MKSTGFELTTVAVNARAEGERIVVCLADDREISFPVALNRKLREAQPAQRADLEIIERRGVKTWKSGKVEDK